ncbi:p-aminobenzoyl-glutamate hydrolase subunit B [Echria macrotheca]|uniref:Peptidase M20 domain-containing protein 2 n=1 Tax=Echria macrotheca TaxID=438768 RepID=A0AAJ0B425_9PEZI|nr:p-aminobenzoyl-glutamate hydrolase subunit B [Echria macrotheca]
MTSTQAITPPSNGTESWPAFIANHIDVNDVHIRTINDKVHANPELAYEEHQAHDLFVAVLQQLGYAVTPHAHGVETAFSAESGTGGRLVVFNAEYDALPDIGHACGHNLIASSSFAAFLGAAAALKESGQPGRVRLLGTPAEEGGGGKLKLIAAGAYRGAAASLMVHPGPGYLLTTPVRGVAFVRMLANTKFRAYFTGREAHAAMAPWTGVNALDAVCLSYNAVSMLRQQIRPHERIHGVFRAAGDRPNVVPAHCCVEYYVRSDTRANAQALRARVLKCFEGASLATGCELRIEDLNNYADVRPSAALCRAYVDAMEAGTVSYDQPADFLAGSTDMGDVTYECPGLHAAFGIETAEGQGNHTLGFAAAAGTDNSYARAVECGKGMALVAWKVLADDAFAELMTREWEEDMKAAA